jgi:hypothetical protein
MSLAPLIVLVRAMFSADEMGELTEAKGPPPDAEKQSRVPLTAAGPLSPSTNLVADIL